LEESLLRLQQRLEAQLELGDQVKLLSTGGNVLMRESIRLHADYEQHRALRARAITFFERSVALSVKAPETVHRLASLYLEDGDADRAIAVLQKRLDKRRYSFDTLLFLCKAYNQKLFSLKAQMKSEEEMTPVLEALIAQCKLAIHTLSFATPEWMTDEQKSAAIAAAYFERAFGEILFGHHLSAIDHLHEAIAYHASEISYYEALISSYVKVGNLVKATGVLVAVRQAGFSDQIIEQLKAMIPSTSNGSRVLQMTA
jgi:tetratricopeptide (TPR) repeat protein